MIVVTLPWPAREVWPNFRQSHHWRTYEAPVRLQREGAKALTQMQPASQEDHALLSGDERIPLSVHFYPPDRRHRDDDGMVGAFKSARDGVADALNVNDRRFKPVYYFEEPAKPGRIEVRIG